MGMADDLRVALGNPDTTQYSAAAATLNVNDALKEYTKYDPQLVLDKTSLVTVADQQEYDLSGISGLIKIQECIWETGTILPEQVGADGLPRTGLSNEYQGLSIFSDPGLAEIYEHKVAELRKRMNLQWEQMGDKLYLFPTPVIADKEIWIIFTKLHTESTIPDTDVPYVRKWAMAQAYRYFAGFEKTLSTGVGPASVTRSARELREDARKLEEEFQQHFSNLSGASRT